MSKKRIKEIAEMVRTHRYEDALRACQAIRRDAAVKGSDPDKVPAEVLYYGCCALFGLGHIQQAGEWVDAHGEVTNYSPANLYLEAFLHLHKRSVDEALGCWTGIVQHDPSETLADVLIEKIKAEEERTLRELETLPAAFEEFVPLPWARRYTPGRSFHKPGKKSARPAGDSAGEADSRPRSTAGRRTNRTPRRGLLREIWNLPGLRPGLAGLVVLGLVAGGVAYFEPGSLVPGNWTGVLEDRLPLTPSGGAVVLPAELEGEVLFPYSDRAAVIAEYDRARELALQGLPNQARFLLGKIELSNATFEIKERALLLRDSLPYLRREHFQDALTPAQVAAQPYLLRGAQVFWRGRVKEPTGSGDSLRFLLDGAASVEPPANPSIPAAGADSPAFQSLSVLVNFGQPGGTLPQLKAGQAVRVFGVLEENESGPLVIRAREVLPE